MCTILFRIVSHYGCSGSNSGTSGREINCIEHSIILSYSDGILICSKIYESPSVFLFRMFQSNS